MHTFAGTHAHVDTRVHTQSHNQQQEGTRYLSPTLPIIIKTACPRSAPFKWRVPSNAISCCLMTLDPFPSIVGSVEGELGGTILRLPQLRSGFRSDECACAEYVVCFLQVAGSLGIDLFEVALYLP